MCGLRAIEGRGAARMQKGFLRAANRRAPETPRPGRPVCEAKLVTRTGLALSIGSGFVENPVGRMPYKVPQDSELPGAARLFPRLKKAFGGFAFCALLDRRYCNETGFALCEANGRPFLITLNEEDDNDGELKTKAFARRSTQDSGWSTPTPNGPPRPRAFISFSKSHTSSRKCSNATAGQREP